jgi:hypothetical protein
MSDGHLKLGYLRQRGPGVVRISLPMGIVGAMIGGVFGLCFGVLPIVFVSWFPRFDRQIARYCVVAFPIVGAAVMGFLFARARKPSAPIPLDVFEVLRHCPDCGGETLHLTSNDSRGKQRFGCKSCGRLTTQQQDAT